MNRDTKTNAIYAIICENYNKFYKAQTKKWTAQADDITQTTDYRQWSESS